MSAYTGKRRPEYERMLADLADGLVDAVLVYNIDRLTRRPAELEQFHEAVRTAKVAHVRFVTGDTNMLTADGLMHLRILGAFAAKESANIGRRVARKMDQVAAEGRPHGGARRPFGYADDKITLCPEEAEDLRALVARFLAGESMRSLATWLNDQQVPTVTGREGWSTTTLRGMLTNPRYAGLRVHRGPSSGPAVWEPIISEEDHRRVLSLFAQRKTSGRRAPQRYLLTGMLRCGKCGTRLYSSARQGNRRYVMPVRSRSRRVRTPDRRGRPAGAVHRGRGASPARHPRPGRRAGWTGKCRRPHAGTQRGVRAGSGTAR